MISWSNNNFIFLGYHTLEGDRFIFAITLFCVSRDLSTGELVGGCLQGCLWQGPKVTLAALESANFCRHFPLVHPWCWRDWRSIRAFIVFGLAHYPVFGKWFPVHSEYLSFKDALSKTCIFFPFSLSLSCNFLGYSLGILLLDTNQAVHFSEVPEQIEPLRGSIRTNMAPIHFRVSGHSSNSFPSTAMNSTLSYTWCHMVKLK